MTKKKSESVESPAPAIEKIGARVLSDLVPLGHGDIVSNGNARTSDPKDVTIRSLADNIKAVGQLVPIIVRMAKEPGKYELIASRHPLPRPSASGSGRFTIRFTG